MTCKGSALRGSGRAHDAILPEVAAAMHERYPEPFETAIETSLNTEVRSQDSVQQREHAVLGTYLEMISLYGLDYFQSWMKEDYGRRKAKMNETVASAVSCF